MIDVIGGTYRESCAFPEFDDIYGSGLRSVMNLLTIDPQLDVFYHTCAGPRSFDYLEQVCKVFSGLKIDCQTITRTGSFYYEHPMATPRIFCPSEHITIKAKGESVLVFGMIEADSCIEANWCVYDPQSPVNPRSFIETMSSANHLTIVLNRTEASMLTGENDVFKIRDSLFSKEHCECLVLKCGPLGAMVFSSAQADGVSIPSYKTNAVRPIGSGDVFTSAFALNWFKGKDPVASALIASKATAAYCEKGVFIQEPLGDYSPFNYVPRQKKPIVYLAGPFFTLQDTWMINECYQCLCHLELDVFSPLHHIGRGDANEVAPRDIEGIDKCDIVFALLDHLDSGTLFEIGYAISKQKKVIVYVQNEREEDLKMLLGTGCIIETDFSTALYKTYWEAYE